MTKDQLTQANALSEKLSTQKEKAARIQRMETIDALYVDGQYFKISPALGKTIYLLTKQEVTDTLNDLQQQFDAL